MRPSPTPSLQALHALRKLAFPRSTNLSICPALPITSQRIPSSEGPIKQIPARRNYHTTPVLHSPSAPSPPPVVRRHKTNPYAPRHTSRGPSSSESTALNDFSSLDIFSSTATPPPAISIDATLHDGFHLSNGVRTTDGDGSGLVLLGGEAFLWRPWESIPKGESMLNKKGTLTLPEESLRLLTCLHPLPDLLIVGTGRSLWPLSKETREFLGREVGVRLEVLDTANASASYNLLATERGLGEGGVGALLLCGGWSGR